MFEIEIDMGLGGFCFILLAFALFFAVGCRFSKTKVDRTFARCLFFSFLVLSSGFSGAYIATSGEVTQEDKEYVFNRYKNMEPKYAALYLSDLKLLTKDGHLSRLDLFLMQSFYERHKILMGREDLVLRLSELEAEFKD